MLYHHADAVHVFIAAFIPIYIYLEGAEINELKEKANDITDDIEIYTYISWKHFESLSVTNQMFLKCSAMYCRHCIAMRV